ncbi:hypothetical protein ARMGADRAFT_432369 [Armillaria gallica]|uniref:Uncharacterized protein n=1 Tax=Armillaria gallica TaxID=47427 RepID=A0A2H3CZG7_ARMGA|nr:hypothetical protein ARMGADRAFT_432369 [Armillaria gallica]
MIPKMLETARKHSVIPILVIVTSDVHYWTMIEKDVIVGPSILAKLSDKDYCTKEVMNHRYFDSKLFNALFTRSPQLHVPSPPMITVNSVNPSFCFSGLRTGTPANESEAMRKEEEELCFTTEEGSRQFVYGAVGLLDDEEKLREKYIQMSDVAEECNFVISGDGRIVQDKGELLDILGKINPKVSDVAKAYLD